MDKRRLALFGATIVALLCSLALPCAQAGTTDRNVILVTLDGVRIQELFTGMSAEIAASDDDSGAEDIAVTRQRYWRDTPQERREALMPFVWKTLVPAGMVVGNQALGSKATVRNDQWFSYPGYSEILTGEPQAEVKSNDLVRYPHQTVLEYVLRSLQLKPTEVAQIGSWDGFKMAASQRDGTFFMNGAFELVPAEFSTPEMEQLGALVARTDRALPEHRRQVVAGADQMVRDVVLGEGMAHRGEVGAALLVIAPLEAEPIDALTLKGIHRPVSAFNITAAR